MAHPKDPIEAVAALGVDEGSTVIAMGPDHGFVEAFAEACGDGGKVMVQAPPPDLESLEGVEVVDDVAADVKADVVVAWTMVVPAHAVRALTAHVAESGSLWLVLPKVGRDDRAPVAEGDLKKALLSAGWREDRVQALSADSVAIGYRRRR